MFTMMSDMADRGKVRHKLLVNWAMSVHFQKYLDKLEKSCSIFSFSLYSISSD